MHTAGVHHLSGIFILRGGGTPPKCNIYPEWGAYTTSLEHFSIGGGVHHLSGIFILRVGVHHLSGISIHRGGRTPPQWNIFPEGGGYTTSVEYLSTRGGGGHHLSGISIPRGGAYTTSVEHFCTGGGVHHLSGIFIPRGGVHHLSGISIQRGGRTPP